MTLFAPSAPLITVRHDWADPVDVEPTIPSRVLTAETGEEQRLALSHVAATIVTYRLLAPTANDAAQLKTVVDEATDGLVRIPRWEDEARVTTAVTAGATTIPCDPNDRPTFVAGSEVLLWRSPTNYEVAVIDTVGASSIDTVDALAADWGAGTIVVPISEARLVTPLSLTHWVPTSGALTVSFEVGLRDLAGLGSGGTAVAGTPATLTLMWRGPLYNTLYRFGRAMVTAEVFDAAGVPLTNVDITWTSADDTDFEVWPTLNPHVAVVEATRVLAGFDTVALTATAGAASDSINVQVWS
jgi:hypothetical protein